MTVTAPEPVTHVDLSLTRLHLRVAAVTSPAPETGGDDQPQVRAPCAQ